MQDLLLVLHRSLAGNTVDGSRVILRAVALSILDAIDGPGWPINETRAIAYTRAALTHPERHSYLTALELLKPFKGTIVGICRKLLSGVTHLACGLIESAYFTARRMMRHDQASLDEIDTRILLLIG